MRVFMVNPPPINISARYSRALYQFTLQDTDTEELYRWAPILEEKMKTDPGAAGRQHRPVVNNPQISIDLNRDRISALGLTVNQVQTAMFNAYGTRQISQIYAPNNQYQVCSASLPSSRATRQRCPALRPVVERPAHFARHRHDGDDACRTADDQPYRPASVGHHLVQPQPGVALGDAVAAIQQVAGNTLPSAMSTSFQGTAQAFQDSLQGLGLILVMAIVVIYLVLGILYESFTHPLTILSGLPSAGFGALLTLLIFKMELSLYAFVGVIMLVGLVKKNGIMMVDFAIAAQERGKEPLEAIHEACLVRFRPIMMTTMAALVGTLPIAVGLGAGAESRRPLGMAVVGGLLVSQLLTLYITPVYYVYIERARMRLASRRKAPQAAVAPAAAAIVGTALPDRG